MLTAIYPFWLVAFPLVAAVGLLALWRGRQARHPIPAARLWQGLAGEAAGHKARVLDPAWTAIFAAAVLAALALPGIQLHWMGAATAGPPIALEAAMRARATGEKADLFVRAASDGLLPNSLALRFEAEGLSLQRAVTPDDLRTGLTWQVPRAAHATVALGAADRILATRTLDQITQAPFGLMTLGPVATALQRVLAIQPGSRPGDVTVRPTVWLIDDPHFAPADLPAGAAVVIASPRTPLPGLELGEWVEERAQSVVAKTAGGLLEAVRFDDPTVHAARYHRAKLATDWTTLASVGSAETPWLALRRDTTSGITYIWLASRMVPAETNWPVTPSFIIFFANLTNQLRPAGPTENLEWLARAPDAAAPLPSNARALTLDTRTPCAALAAAAALLGMGLLARRAR